MEIKLYFILLIYFMIGGIMMYFVNRKKELAFRKHNWLKYFVYLVLINLLFASILFKPISFSYISIAIIFFGFFEISKLTYNSKKFKAGLIALLIFVCFASVFYQFSLMPKRYLFYTLFLTTVFDAFSQLTGQLFGRKKIFRKISPNKTYAGLIGGITFTLLTSVLIRNQLTINVLEAVFLGMGVSGFALIGDVLASFCKRNFNVKDFSKAIPGHGGVLDRFDSLISAGSFMFLIANILKI